LRIARVIGTLVSTVQHPDHVSHKLLFVQPLDGAGRPVDDSMLAIDGAQAGIGDTVLLVQEGKGARQVMGSETAPCEAVIVGIVDSVNMGGEEHPDDD